MPMEEIKFEFPDPERPDKSTEVEGNTLETPVDLDDDTDEFEVEGDNVGNTDEVEVVDDTPKKDRNRKPADEPPELVSDDELQSYSQKIRKRIEHLGRGYHDERRAKEAAQRERDELEQYARAVTGKLKELEESSGKSREMLLSQAKHAANLEYEQSKKEYRDAYESGDADAVLNAQDKLTGAKMKLERVTNFKLPPVQKVETNVQTTQQAPSAPKIDERTTQWYSENSWFGSDDEMTAFALGYHNKLLKGGVSLGSDDYYEKLNSRMRQVFPEAFDDGIDEEIEQHEEKRPTKSPSVVAPATRSTASKKIVLTKSAVAIAKRMGVPLAEYAKQVAELRKQNNG